MNAKSYLLRISRIDRALRRNAEELELLKANADCICGSFTEGERVKSSNVIGDRMAEAVAEYIDLQIDIIRESTELEKERRAIINNLKKLDAEECDLLYGVYVKGHTLHEMENLMFKSYSYITSKHGTALRHLQEIIDNEK